MGGTSLINLYLNSPSKLLSAIYPNYEWIPWKFQKIAAKGWETSARKFMEMLSKEFKIKTLSDWYNVSKKDIERFEGGSAILGAHQRSMYRLFVSVYPEYPWIPSKFKSKAWSDPDTWKTFMDAVGKTLNVKELKDWYNIKTEVFSGSSQE